MEYSTQRDMRRSARQGGGFRCFYPAPCSHRGSSPLPGTQPTGLLDSYQFPLSGETAGCHSGLEAPPGPYKAAAPTPTSRRDPTDTGVAKQRCCCCGFVLQGADLSGAFPPTQHFSTSSSSQCPQALRPHWQKKNNSPRSFSLTRSPKAERGGSWTKHPLSSKVPGADSSRRNRGGAHPKIQAHQLAALVPQPHGCERCSSGLPKFPACCALG